MDSYWLGISNNSYWLGISNNIEVTYSDDYSVVKMINNNDKSNNQLLSIELNNLDNQILKLGYIIIYCNDYQMLNLKISDIMLTFGAHNISYPIFLFNITKIDNGYKIDLDYLKEVGIEHIIPKLCVYHYLKLHIYYEGQINNCELYYKKSLNNNIQSTNMTMVVNNINYKNVKSTTDNILIKLAFLLSSDEIVIMADNIDEDFKEVLLKFENNIVENYIINLSENNIIIKFNEFINFNNINNISLFIQFKNIKNRDINIYNKCKNLLDYKSGTVMVRYIHNYYTNNYYRNHNKMFELNKLVNNNGLYVCINIINNLSLIDTQYM